MTMRTRSLFFAALLASVVFTAFIACSGNRKEEAASDADHAHDTSADTTRKSGASSPQHTVDAAFQQQLATVFTAYLPLKDALVASDASNAKAQATTTSEALSKTDMKLLSGAAHHDWMTYLGGLESSLKEIQASSDIEAQRKAFSTLSDHLYKAVKAYGLGGQIAYYDFCPMAFNSQGGYWLSDTEQIKNPYFGDKMLTCGSVEETLK